MKNEYIRKVRSGNERPAIYDASSLHCDLNDSTDGLGLRAENTSSEPETPRIPSGRADNPTEIRRLTSRRARLLAGEAESTEAPEVLGYSLSLTPGQASWYETSGNRRRYSLSSYTYTWTTGRPDRRARRTSGKVRERAARHDEDVGQAMIGATLWELIELLVGVLASFGIVGGFLYWVGILFTGVIT
mgnify:CR=1 FL=1